MVINMYKKSKFNIITNYENYYIISNTLEKTIVVLSELEYYEYNILPENSIVSNKFTNMLYDCGLLTLNDNNEIKDALSRHEIAKNNTDFLNVTIVPTFNCNFDCFYCYQQNMPTGKLDKNKCKSIIKFIIKRADLMASKNIHIAWYGGEPLLCFEQIKYVNKSIIKYYKNTNINITSSIATNAYLLSDDVIHSLKELNVVRIETTLAGTKEYHDKLRYLKSKKNGTFNVVFKNIKKVSKIIPTIININVSYDNLDDMNNLILLLKRQLRGCNIYVNFNKIGMYQHMKNNVNEIKDFEPIKIKLLMECLKNNINICDNTNFDKDYIFCPQQHINSFSIDYNCNLYKCAEYFESYDCIGKIDIEGNASYIKDSKTSKNSKKCLKCNLLPYCNFGCDTNRRKKIYCCPEEKKHINDYLKIYFLKHQLDDITRGGENDESNC